MQFTQEARIALRMANFFNETNMRANAAAENIDRLVMKVPTDIVNYEEREILIKASALLQDIMNRTDQVALREAVEAHLNNLEEKL